MDRGAHRCAVEGNELDLGCMCRDGQQKQSEARHPRVVWSTQIGLTSEET